MLARSTVLAVATVLATALCAHGQGGKPKPGLLVVQAAPAAGGSLTISFVQIGAPLTQLGANQATLDLGTLSYFGGNPLPGVTFTRLSGVLEAATDFGIRVDRKGSATKTASVSAFLVGTGPATVRLDAVTLTSSAQVIPPTVDFGTVVSHKLTVGVPTTAPAGPLAITIGIMAVTN